MTRLPSTHLPPFTGKQKARDPDGPPGLSALRSGATVVGSGERSCCDQTEALATRPCQIPVLRGGCKVQALQVDIYFYPHLEGVGLWETVNASSVQEPSWPPWHISPGGS